MFLHQVAKVPPVTASPETSVLDAIRLMADNEVGAVVVTDTNGKVIGIFTERDNMLRVTLRGLDTEKTKIKDVMTTSVKTASPDMSATDALNRMVRSKHRHLPVVDKTGKVIGVASIRQLLMKRLDEQKSDIETLEAYVTAGGPG
ncbi:MAG TPA: CBS domain-containing protein [Planctomycetota bacterium]|nr:CBS domain-containing protein [Planctomycetota bacterium]